jgi:hypothetical protein
LPGKSGNPSGRPISKAASISDLTKTVELLARKRISPERIANIVESTARDAEGGDNKARKLIFDYFLAKPSVSTEDDSDKGKGGIVIRIENATFKAQKSESNTQVIEGEYSES